jgi:hypothetical protein
LLNGAINISGKPFSHASVIVEWEEENTCSTHSGLPEKLKVSNQKSLFGHILEGLRLITDDIFCGHLDNFTDIWDIFDHLVHFVYIWYIFFRFWYHVPMYHENLATLPHSLPHFQSFLSEKCASYEANRPPSFELCCDQGLPDFSWYNAPKRGETTPNYQLAVKYTKLR